MLTVKRLFEQIGPYVLKCQIFILRFSLKKNNLQVLIWRNLGSSPTLKSPLQR